MPQLDSSVSASPSLFERSQAGENNTENEISGLGAVELGESTMDIGSTVLRIGKTGSANTKTVPSADSTSPQQSNQIPRTSRFTKPLFIVRNFLFAYTKEQEKGTGSTGMQYQSLSRRLRRGGTGQN